MSGRGDRRVLHLPVLGAAPEVPAVHDTPLVDDSPADPAPARRRRRRAAGWLASLPSLARTFVEVRRARAKVTAPRRLPLLYIETTLECNARCGMCGYPSDYPAQDHELGIDELFTIVDDAAELGTLIISVGGGEPFLRRDAEALIQYIDAAGIVPFVHTNGSLLTPRRCQRLARRSRLALAMSLDSHRREVHDRIRKLRCFDRVCTSARYFARHAPHVHVVFTFTITGVNYRDMLPAARLARDLGVRTIRFTPLHENLQHRFKPARELAPFRIAEDDIPAVVEELARTREFCRRNDMISNSEAFTAAIPDYLRGPVPHRCYAGFLFSSIDPYGNLFPCYDHVGEVNVRDHGGLRAAFESAEMERLRRRVVSCSHRCWNVGNAEPSLRLDGAALLRQAPQILRESLFFFG